MTRICVDGCIVKAPCAGQVAGRSPVDRGKQGTKRSLAVEGHGMPIGVVIAPANRHDSPLLAGALETGLGRFGFDTPERITIHLDQATTRPQPAACSRCWDATTSSPARENPCKPEQDGWSSAPTPGITEASRSSPCAHSEAPQYCRHTSHWPTPSSSYAP